MKRVSHYYSSTLCVAKPNYNTVVCSYSERDLLQYNSESLFSMVRTLGTMCNKTFEADITVQ